MAVAQGERETAGEHHPRRCEQVVTGVQHRCLSVGQDLPAQHAHAAVQGICSTVGNGHFKRQHQRARARGDTRRAIAGRSRINIAASALFDR